MELAVDPKLYGSNLEFAEAWNHFLSSGEVMPPAGSTKSRFLFHHLEMAMWELAGSRGERVNATEFPWPEEQLRRPMAMAPHDLFMDQACRNEYRVEANEIFLQPVLEILEKAAEDIPAFPFCQEYRDVISGLVPMPVSGHWESGDPPRRLFRMWWRGHWCLYFEFRARNRATGRDEHFFSHVVDSADFPRFFGDLEVLFNDDIHQYLALHLLNLAGVGLDEFLRHYYPDAPVGDMRAVLTRNNGFGGWRLEGYIT